MSRIVSCSRDKRNPSPRQGFHETMQKHTPPGKQSIFLEVVPFALPLPPALLKASTKNILIRSEPKHSASAANADDA